MAAVIYSKEFSVFPKAFVLLMNHELYIMPRHFSPRKLSTGSKDLSPTLGVLSYSNKSLIWECTLGLP